jgi:hypothetical protein
MAVEKREDGWYAEGSGPYVSRQAAREAQADPEATYADNVTASEVLDATEDAEADATVAEVNEEFPNVEGFDRELAELSDGSVTRESAKDVRKRENIVYMALYANTAPARAYWRKLAETEGYEVPAEV